MAGRKKMTWTRVGIIATLMIGVPSLSGAQETGVEFANVEISAALPSGEQGRRRGESEAEYTPAPGARDLKSVIFNWAWHMGMLRSTEEYDLLIEVAVVADDLMACLQKHRRHDRANVT